MLVTRNFMDYEAMNDWALGMILLIQVEVSFLAVYIKKNQ